MRAHCQKHANCYEVTKTTERQCLQLKNKNDDGDVVVSVVVRLFIRAGGGGGGGGGVDTQSTWRSQQRL